MIALKLAAAPLVGWLASQAGRRFGHRVAGLIGGLSAYRRADHAVPGLGRTTRPNVAVCAGLATRGAAETAAHLVDRVFAPLPVKQWGIEVSQRLRTCLQRDTALQGTLLRIFLSVTGRCLREHSPCGPAAAPIEALASIHRFGSSLNEHLHFHCCVDATGADHEDRRPGAAAACASPSLLRCAGAQCTAEVGGGGARPCRRAASTDFRGDPRCAPRSCRVALPVGHVAGADISGVPAAVPVLLQSNAHHRLHQRCRHCGGSSQA